MTKPDFNLRTMLCVTAMFCSVASCSARTTTSAGGTSSSAARTTRAPNASNDPTDHVSRLRDRVTAYAHDTTLGRAAGTAAHNAATDYIANEARKIGLAPGADGSYFQRVPLKRRTLSARTRLIVGADTLLLGRDLAAFVMWLDARSFDGATVIYAGSTADSITLPPELLRGKIVLLKAPAGATSVGARSYPPDHPLAGAAAIVTTNVDAVIPGFVRRTREPIVGVPPDGGDRLAATLLVTTRAAESMMGQALDGMQPGTVGRAVRGAIEYEMVDIPSNNVVALLPGSDETLRNEYVLLSAHSDHTGIAARAVEHDSTRAFRAAMHAIRTRNNGELPMNEYSAIRVNIDSLRAIRPARMDSINNGADDDASGSMALLTIAEQLVKQPPRRSVLFVWHTGEETNLTGSRWFTEHPTVPLESIVTVVNLDMIGRGSATEETGGGPDYVQVLGARRLSSSLGNSVELANRRSTRPLELRYEYDAAGHRERLFCRSDHAMYARFGIPTLFLTTGMHGDYHMVTDEAQYIDYMKLARIATFAADIAREIGNAASRPAVDGVRPLPGAPCEH